MLYAKTVCDQLNDMEIIQQALNEADYFSCLYDRYEPRLLAYIRRITPVSTAEAEDILQEAFIKIWRHLNEVDPDMKVSPWIYRIVHNETISFSRKKGSYGKNRTVAAEAALLEVAEDAVEYDHIAEDISTRITQEILDALPVKYKTILVLRYWEEMSYEEISDVLHMPEGTVATQLNRAKKAFAQLADQHPLK